MWDVEDTVPYDSLRLLLSQIGAVKAALVFSHMA